MRRSVMGAVAASVALTSIATILVAVLTSFSATAGASSSGTASASGSSIKNRFSALCVGVGSKTKNSTPVIQWGCNKASDELWDWVSTTDSHGRRAFFLRNTYSKKCIGVASSLEDGAGAIQYTCNGAVDEKWWYGAMINLYSGKCR